LTIKHDPDRVKVNLGRLVHLDPIWVMFDHLEPACQIPRLKAFPSKVTVRTHKHTDTPDRVLYLGQ